MYQEIEKRVREEWGRFAWDRLSPSLQRALLAERILYLATAQDESVSSDTVRRIVENGHAWLSERESR